MLERYARLPIDSPRQIVLVVALVTLIVSPFLLRVEFSTDVQAFLPQSDEVETYDLISEDFGKDSSIVNLYLTSVSGGNVLTMNNLVDILEIHNNCLQIQGVKSVLSVADFFDSALIDSGLSLSTASSAEEPWELVYESISTTGSGNYSWEHTSKTYAVESSGEGDSKKYILAIKSVYTFAGLENTAWETFDIVKNLSLIHI